MRLIDADELKKEVKTMFCPDGYKIMCLNIISNAPTVEEISIVEFKEPLPPVKAQKINCGGKIMFNIASYQEGFTDGYTDGKEASKKLLRQFIAEQHIEDPDRPHNRGYNSALKDLGEFIEEML